MIPFTNYGVIVASLGVLALGVIYVVAGRPYDKGQAPAGDAHRLTQAKQLISD